VTTAAAPIDITVVICTRDRAAQLSNALQTAAQMRIPSDLNWEFIVVDNGSSDSTAEVVKAFEDRLPLRLVHEDRAGLSNARNKGVAEASGRYICWTDDDVELDPEWLAAYWVAFQRHPEAAVFGGRITPVLEPPTPDWFAWLKDDWPIKILLAQRDFGSLPCPLDFAGGLIPWGANYAIRTADQRTVSYEPGLGASPHHRRIGEEVEVIFRLMAGGATGWWVPGATVNHIISPHRQSWDYIFDYATAYGETLAYMERTWPGAHHAASATRDITRVRHSPLHLAIAGHVYRTTAALAQLGGAKRRATKLLAVAGLYAGAARFAQKTIVRPLPSGAEISG
jgi:glycosyltransferase involved in cell wall biosynthesis